MGEKRHGEMQRGRWMVLSFYQKGLEWWKMGSWFRKQRGHLDGRWKSSTLNQSSQQMGPMTGLVLSLGKTTAQIVAQFSPVPGLYPAVLLLIAIIETCEGVIYNRQAACSTKYSTLIQPPETQLGAFAIDATILLSHSAMYVRLHQAAHCTPRLTILWG